MPTSADYFPSKYLKSEDLKGIPRLVTIREVVQEPMTNDGKTENKPVAYFEETEKGMVLNKTNFEICALITKEPDDLNWSGHKIVIAAELKTFMGKPKMGLSVRMPQGSRPNHPPAHQTENPAPSNGFAKRAAPPKQQIADQNFDAVADATGAGFDDEIPF